MTSRVFVSDHEPTRHSVIDINDNTFYGSTRFQKYGFLLYKQYSERIKNNFPDLIFYDDWKAHYYGPHSEKLENDIQKCVMLKLIRKSSITTEKKQKMNMYALTIKGRMRWCALSSTVNEMSQINKKIKNPQKIPHYTLIRKIYNAYPDYTTKSKIIGQFDI